VFSVRLHRQLLDVGGQPVQPVGRLHSGIRRS
jgi:hypothetical protein